MFLFHKQQIIICIVATIMGAAFVFGRFIPLRNQAMAVEQEMSTKSQAISKGSADAARCITLRKQLDHNLASAKGYEAGIPDERALGTFLSEIADLMNQHRLKDQVVAPGEQIKTPEITCIPINMQCVGSFTDVFNFFQDLNKIERFIRIQKVKITNDETLNGSVSMQTDAVIFYRTDSAEKENAL